MHLNSRPYLENFMAIATPKGIAIKMAVSIRQKNEKQATEANPWQELDFFEKSDFRIKVIGLSHNSKAILIREYDTDDYANLAVKIPRKIADEEISNLLIYELSHNKGIETYLGSFIPISLGAQSKLVISDFDKTLVDTRYSSPRELYDSLRNPIHHFPTVERSVDLLKDKIKEKFNVFILSASPHFYEKPIRDWLYGHEIYTSQIFLKDYRKIFSFFESELTTKDIKQQGFYKLQQLSEILLMTKIPKSLVLFGDGFESDTSIYLILRAIIVEKIDPWILWQEIKKLKAFNLNSKQESFILTKLHQVASLKVPENHNFEIFIRCKESNIEEIKTKDLEFWALEKQKKFVQFYSA